MIGGSRGWTDYTVSADVMPTPLKTGFAAVAGRYQDAGDFYQCDIHHTNSLQLWRMRGGVATLLDSTPAAIDPARFSNLRLVMSGERLSCSLDGALVCSAVDASFTHGAVALIAGAGDAAQFDKVTVTTAPRNHDPATIGSRRDNPRMHGRPRADAGGELDGVGGHFQATQPLQWPAAAPCVHGDCPQRAGPNPMGKTFT